MKKVLFYIAILSIMVSCKKTSYVAKFDKTPQERVAEKISLVSTTLAGSTTGWVATLSTQSGGGFGFYMSFDNNQNVSMYADLTDASSSVAGKSYYRVKQDNGIGLVFDSYNYISMLDDPSAAVYGGTAKVGYGSDIEFTFDRVNGDSIVFVGKKYRQPFVLVKATAAQKTAYEAAGLKTAIDKFKAFFTENRNPYVEIVSGSASLKIGVTPSLSTSMATGKRVDFTGVLGDGKTINSKGAKFAYNLTGADFLNGGFVYEGIRFVKFAWKDATTLAAYDSTGKEYIIKNSLVPLLDINLLWGTKFTGLRSEYKQINPGTSASGTTILNAYHNNLTAASLGFNFNYGRMDLTWNRVNKRLSFDGFTSQNGGTSGWTANITYSYTVNADGSYKFTTFAAASGNYSAPVMVQLDSFLKNNDVKFDYYTDNGILYCKMSSVNDPTIIMTWLLR